MLFWLFFLLNPPPLIFLFVFGVAPSSLTMDFGCVLHRVSMMMENRKRRKYPRRFKEKEKRREKKGKKEEGKKEGKKEKEDAKGNITL